MLCSLSKTVKFLSSGMTLYWVNKYDILIQFPFAAAGDFFENLSSFGF